MAVQLKLVVESKMAAKEWRPIVLVLQLLVPVLRLLLVPVLRLVRLMELGIDQVEELESGRDSARRSVSEQGSNQTLVIDPILMVLRRSQSLGSELEPVLILLPFPMKVLEHLPSEMLPVVEVF